MVSKRIPRGSEWQLPPQEVINFGFSPLLSLGHSLTLFCGIASQTVGIHMLVPVSACGETRSKSVLANI